MKKWIYRWLPRFFGCHARPDRSFYINNIKLPICARCTGELIGILFAMISNFFYIPSAKILFVLLIPMVIDGFLQLLTKYESNNLKRVITGFLFGYALFSLFIISNIIVFQYGRSLKGS